MTILDEIDAIDTCITILENERLRLYPLIVSNGYKRNKNTRDYLEVVRTLNGLFNLMSKLQKQIRNDCCLARDGIRNVY